MANGATSIETETSSGSTRKSFALTLGVLTLEVANFFFVLFGCSTSFKGAQVSPLTGRFVLLDRINAVSSTRKFSYHVNDGCNSFASAATDEHGVTDDNSALLS